MLLSEPLVRLNEVILKIRETLDFMRFLQENHAATPAAQDLDGQEAAYRQSISELQEDVRRLGGLPRDVDPEFEMVEQAWAELKAVFGENEESALLQELNKFRYGIIDTVQWALEVDYPQDLKLRLQRVSRYTQDVMAGPERAERRAQ